MNNINHIKDIEVYIDNLNNEADKVRINDPASSLNKSRESIELSKLHGYLKGLAKANLIAGISCRLLSEFELSLEFYSSALENFRKLEDTLGESRTLNSIGNVYLSLSKYEEAVSFFDKSLALLENTDDRNFEAIVNSNKALALQQCGDLVGSLKCYLYSLKIYTENGIDIHHSLYNNIGIVYLETEDYYSAMEYFNHSLKLAVKNGSLNDQSLTLANIGRTYVYLNDPENALTYLSEANIVIKKLGNKQMESQIMSNMGKAYIKLKRYDEASTCFHKSLKYYREIRDINSVAHTLSELGELYFETNNFSDSKKYFEEGLKTSLKSNNEVDAVRNYTGLAKLYVKFMDYKKASGYLNKAEFLAGKRNSLKELAKIFKLFSKAYFSNGQTEIANQYIEKYYDISRKLRNLGSENKLKIFSANKGISRSKTKYITDRPSFARFIN